MTNPKQQPHHQAPRNQWPIRYQLTRPTEPEVTVAATLATALTRAMLGDGPQKEQPHVLAACQEFLGKNTPFLLLLGEATFLGVTANIEFDRPSRAARGDGTTVATLMACVTILGRKESIVFAVSLEVIDGEIIPYAIS